MLALSKNIKTCSLIVLGLAPIITMAILNSMFIGYMPLLFLAFPALFLVAIVPLIAPKIPSTEQHHIYLKSFYCLGTMLAVASTFLITSTNPLLCLGLGVATLVSAIGIPLTAIFLGMEYKSYKEKEKHDPLHTAIFTTVTVTATLATLGGIAGLSYHVATTNFSQCAASVVLNALSLGANAPIITPIVIVAFAILAAAIMLWPEKDASNVQKIKVNEVGGIL